jgi:hypothetical protein
MDDDDNSSITIDYSSLNYTIPPVTTGAIGANYNYNTLPYGNVTISTVAGSSGSFLTSGSNGTSWTNNSGLHVSSDATFDGDIKWKGHSLGKLLEKIEDRLAILAEPDPVKLEKYAALKKAYDHYKLMEKLIGED